MTATMYLDRLGLLSALIFLKTAIPKGGKEENNCLFVRVEKDKVIFIAGGKYVTKKVVMDRPITTEESADPDQVKPIPETFMIPKPDILAFITLINAHKATCKNLPETDPVYLFIEISGTALISNGVRIIFDQPKHKYEDFEPLFENLEGPVPETFITPGNMESAIKGFNKSSSYKISSKGDFICFKQDEFEALVLPPIEKEPEQNNSEDQEQF